MKLDFLRVALCVATCMLVACGNDGVPVKTSTLTGTMKLNPQGDALLGFTNAAAKGRLLQLYVNNDGWNENLGSVNYYGRARPAVSISVISESMTFNLNLPGEVNAAYLNAVTGFWTTNPFSKGSCKTSAASYSNPQQKLGMAILRVMPGGDLLYGVDVRPEIKLNHETSRRTMIARSLIYADRDGYIKVQYDCTSEFNLRMSSDTVLDLKAGWNILEKTSIEEDSSANSAVYYAYSLRSRPVNDTSEMQDLFYFQKTIFFD